jgi:hypothetical protein
MVSGNSVGGSIASEAGIVDVAFGCEATHEPAKRETAIAIVMDRFIRKDYSCVYKIVALLVISLDLNRFSK